MIIAQLKTGENPGEPSFLTSKQLEERYTKRRGEAAVCLQTEVVWWAKNGRHGSRCIVDSNVYVLVENKKDDPLKYYKPEVKINGTPNVWGNSHADCCGKSRGGSTSGCNSGKCSSGGCGNHP